MQVKDVLRWDWFGRGWTTHPYLDRKRPPPPPQRSINLSPVSLYRVVVSTQGLT